METPEKVAILPFPDPYCFGFTPAFCGFEKEQPERHPRGTVGKRLIIQRGERITRHELTDKAVMIGRDPSCDFFFSDQKLSRRHARIEPRSDGVRLVDLGSRNGCWVNDRKVDDCLVRPGDTVRLGGLRITLEDEPPAASAGDAEATVMFSVTGQTTGAPPVTPASEGGPGDTVLFSDSSRSELDRTLVPSIGPGDDMGAATFQGPAHDQRLDTATRVLSPMTSGLGRERELFDATEPPSLRRRGPDAEATAEPVERPRDALVLLLRLTLVTSGLALIAYLMGIVVAGVDSVIIGVLGVVLIVALSWAAAITAARLAVAPRSRRGEEDLGSFDPTDPFGEVDGDTDEAGPAGSASR